MTDPTAIDLLSDVDAYLCALHVHVARHDQIGADLTCGGCKLRDRVAAALPQLAAVPPANQTTDRADLRDRIADVVIPLLLDTLPKVIARSRGYEVADAVLAVLPPPADRAAALTEAERTMLTYALDLTQEQMLCVGDEFSDADHAAVDSLRRLAAEAPTTTQPEESGAALARYIADQPVSTIQSAFRVLGWPPLRFELVDDEPAAGARQDGAQP